VTIPDIEALPLNQLDAVVNDTTDRVSKDKLLLLPHSDRVVWESDGQEIEAPPDNDNDCENNAEKDGEYKNYSDDDSDVAWEEDHENSSDTGKEEEDQRLEISTAPYTLEIHLPMTAAGVETADNSIVLQALREISGHMTAHALPALEQWREALSTALGCYHSGNIVQKRKRDSTPPIITGDDEKRNQLQKERMTQKLQDVCAISGSAGHY
jgi:hypothetical protein